MADPIPFPVNPPPGPHSRPTYRAYRFAADGSVRATVLLDAESDAEAERQALALIDRHRVEVWSRGRFVAQFGPHDGPVASAIRLLDDRPTPGT